MIWFTFKKNYLQWGEWIRGLEWEEGRGCLSLQTMVACVRVMAVEMGRSGLIQDWFGSCGGFKDMSTYSQEVELNSSPLNVGWISCWLLAKRIGLTLRDVTSVVRLLTDCSFHLGGIHSCSARLLILGEASYLIMLQLCGEVHEARDCSLPRTMWVSLEDDLTSSIPTQ